MFGILIIYKVKNKGFSSELYSGKACFIGNFRYNRLHKENLFSYISFFYAKKFSIELKIMVMASLSTYYTILERSK